MIQSWSDCPLFQSLRTCVDFTGYAHLDPANARFDDRYVLLGVVDDLVFAILNDLSRRRVPSIRQKGECLELVTCQSSSAWSRRELR